MACPHCGSWAVRSDRGMAGRMVCGRCGQPLGRAGGSLGGRRRPRVGAGLSTQQRLWLALLGLLVVSAVLAGLDNRSQQQRRAPAWGSDATWSP